jgi:hypothetical protein
MAWRLANSLVVLRDQLDDRAPGRNKASDGTIAGPGHPRPTRHLPNGAGVVCALDVTDDPAGNCPIHIIAEHVRLDPHPDLAYVISNSRIASRNTAWEWHRYTGPNPHDRHAHFAVGVGPDSDPRPPYDDTDRWRGVNGGVTPRLLKRGMQGEDVSGLQKILVGAGLLAPADVDGVFGPKTEAAVKAFQQQLGVEADGVVGPATHGAIARLLQWLAAMG